MEDNTVTLAEIEPVAKEHTGAGEKLQDRLQLLQHDIDQAHRRHMPGIKRTLAQMADVETRLRDLVARAAPTVFAKPRTRVLHGVKVGFEKGKGKLTFDKADDVVKRIKKLLPDQVELLIHTEEKPNKEALAKLPASDLKRLGCELTDVGDRVVVRPVGTELEKMIKALLKDRSDDAQAQAQAEAESAEAAP